MIPETEPDDEGKVRLRINPQNAGPAPRIHFAQDGMVSEASPQLQDSVLTTNALRVSFLVIDPSNQFETGEPVTWANKLVLRNRMFEENGARMVQLLVAPRGQIRYTTDGSEPRNGIIYSAPIAIGDGDVLLNVFAEQDGIEQKQVFHFSARGKKDLTINEVKPAYLTSRTGRKLDSRAATFEGLKQAEDKSVKFEGVFLTVGQANQAISIQTLDIPVDAKYIQTILETVLTIFPPDTPITMSFRKAHFASGHDLKEFADKLNIELKASEIEQ